MGASTAHSRKGLRVGTILILCLLITSVLLAQTRTNGKRSRKGRRDTAPLQVIQLPRPNVKMTSSIEKVLQEHTVPQRMRTLPLEVVDISQMAWAAQTQQGAVATIQLYFVTQAGVFLYVPGQHQLQQITGDDQRNALVLATVLPQSQGPVGCAIVLAGPARSRSSRVTGAAQRTALLETGRVAQNLRLQAAGLGITTSSIESFDADTVRKLCQLPRGSEPTYLLFAGYGGGAVTQAANTTATRNKRAIVAIPGSGFQDSELFQTLNVLEQGGITPVVASTHLGLVSGSLGGVTEAKLLLARIDVEQADALIFIGGPGSKQLLTDTNTHRLIVLAHRQGKLIGATSTATTILARAGILNGTRVTAAASESPILVQSGAIYTGEALEHHNRIITASGPAAITAFAQQIIKALQG